MLEGARQSTLWWLQMGALPNSGPWRSCWSPSMSLLDTAPQFPQAGLEAMKGLLLV